MKYKKNFEEVFERHKKFFNREMKDKVLIRIQMPWEKDAYYSTRFAPAAESMLKANLERLEKRRELEDDSLPIAQTTIGSNICPGFLGGEVRFESGISWSEPILTSYGALSNLKFDINNYWLKKVREIVGFFVNNSNGNYGVTILETINNLNFGFALRGEKIYLDIYDHPEDVRKLLEFAVEFNIKVIEMQREIIGEYRGGIFDIFGFWLPGRAIWESVDAYSMCNPEVFNEFGKDYVQKLVDYFGGGFLHLHAKGLHMLPEAMKVNGWVGVQIGNDPNEQDSYNRIDEIKKITGGTPLYICTLSKERLLSEMKKRTLPGNVCYEAEGFTTVKEANDVMKLVKGYTAPT